jgi:hypothetical protein
VPKRKQQQPDSIRWPNLFAKVEEAQLLVRTPGFLTMLADLEVLREALEYDVIHTTPTMELTNFFRGQIAVLERLQDLPEELAEWKKEHR